MLRDGLYEQIISIGLEAQLAASDKLRQTAPIDAGEASKVLASYIGQMVEKALDHVRDEGGGIAAQLTLVNRLVDALVLETRQQGLGAMAVARRAEQLLALMDRQNNALAPDGKLNLVRPETSLAHSSLFTGAVHEPQMYTELKKEINSCDRIDMLVSFIKWSGLRLLIEELTAFAQGGGQLRVITTAYMGATDVKAIEELRKLPNTQIKVSYDTQRTRLHAKTYVFYRATGFSTAYVGSSNLSNAAISSGLEWNVKVTHKDLPETMGKIAATFESYWNADEFEYYDEGQAARLASALHAEQYFDSNQTPLFTMDITPYAYQQEILDKLEAERTVRGHTRNLLVAATGTGKTVISALDYKRFRRQNPHKACRLLFVAHREEILRQSLYTFRAVLKDANFGELFVGNARPDQISHLFMSIQTFNARNFAKRTGPDFYNYIVVDEFHRAAAPSYRSLLGHYQPAILLGLTATPERMDGESILPYFDHRIAAEIRLPEAIDRKLLCPFQYFGVTDTVDLKDLRWRAGGYDKSQLSDLYTISGSIAKRRADMVIASLTRYVTDIDAVKGLGFCVSIAHAAFMSDHFNANGIASICLSGHTPDAERLSAKDRLIKGEVRFIFVVDLYNEGVDIPEVNTVLFLRPTESLTIFLQQLGRGLRLAEDKECLTVLDFIGQAHRKYNFEAKFAALLSNATRSVSREIRDGFLSAPKGCYIQLEKQAARYILDNIRASYGNSAALVQRLATFEEDTGLSVTLADFLTYYHIDVRALYKFSSFSRLCARAGVRDGFTEPLEDTLTRALPRFAVIDSRRFLAFLLDVLTDGAPAEPDGLQLRMLQMLQFTVWQKPFDECGFTSLQDGVQAIRGNPVLCAELIELLHYNHNRIDFLDAPVDIGFACPLDLHCSYIRDQIMVALDFLQPNAVREGVKWLPEQQLDVLFITLDKSEKDYSPTTMYNDYSINAQLFHWQSQSTTAEDSPTGQRYIHHRGDGSRVLLFVREHRTDRVTNRAAAYTYLGTAQYLTHEGSRPMNITWKLDHPIPARFLRKTNRLMVG